MCHHPFTIPLPAFACVYLRLPLPDPPCSSPYLGTVGSDEWPTWAYTHTEELDWYEEDEDDAYSDYEEEEDEEYEDEDEEYEDEDQEEDEEDEDEDKEYEDEAQVEDDGEEEGEEEEKGDRWLDERVLGHMG